jgi:hypothetical protein
LILGIAAAGCGPIRQQTVASGRHPRVANSRVAGLATRAVELTFLNSRLALRASIIVIDCGRFPPAFDFTILRPATFASTSSRQRSAYRSRKPSKSALSTLVASMSV